MKISCGWMGDQAWYQLFAMISYLVYSNGPRTNHLVGGFNVMALEERNVRHLGLLYRIWETQDIL